MDTLFEVEGKYPYAGANMVDTFFSGGKLQGHEKERWKDLESNVEERWKTWKSNDGLYTPGEAVDSAI
jgi:hypothetical protein